MTGAAGRETSPGMSIASAGTLPVLLTWSLFNHAKSNLPTSARGTWEDLVSLLSKSYERVEKDGLAWSPADFCGTRANRNVVSLCAAVFDLDHVSLPALERMEGFIKASGYAAVLHSTHTNKPPDDCKLRLVLRLARQIKPEEWPQLRQHLLTALHIPADPAAKDAARLYYLPSHPPGATPVLEVYPGEPAPVFTPNISRSRAEVLPPDDLSLKVALARVRKPEAKAIITKILEGQPLAAEGERDATLHKAVCILAFSSPAGTTPEAMLELLRPSVESMPGPEGPEHWMAAAEEKLTRALAAKEVKDADDAETKKALESRVRSVSTRAQYTDDQLAAWAKEHGCDLEGFKRRWIIHKGNAYFVFVNGRYRSPIAECELALSLPRDLANAPVDLTRIGTKGIVRLARPSEILEEHGTVARHLEASLALQKSFYDEGSQTFHEATCPVREDLAPVYHPEVDTWLTLLGGLEAAKLYDWVSCVTKLERQAAAIFLEGEAGAGKGLLAAGLARLWRDAGPTEFSSLVSGFNEAIAQCPLVICDEGFPKRRDYSINDELRRWIGASERTLTRKYMPPASLSGAIRLIICANNDRVLDGIEEMGEEDRTALAQRLIYVKVRAQAREYLESLPIEDRQDFMHRRIAEFALWLREHRAVEPGARFIVEGKTSSLHDKLSVNNGLAPAVCEFLAARLMDWTPQLAKAQEAFMRVGNGDVWVTAAAFKDRQTWERLVPGSTYPDTSTLYRTLRNMRRDQIRTLVKSGARPVFNVIKTELLLTWAQLNGVGDVDVLKARIDEPNPEMGLDNPGRAA